MAITIVFRYIRLPLLVVPYFLITIVGHGMAPLGLILISGGFTNSIINILAWVGIGTAVLSALFAPKKYYASIVTLVVLILFTSVIIISSLYSDSTSTVVDRRSVNFFYVCTALFVGLEWFIHLKRIVSERSVVMKSKAA